MLSSRYSLDFPFLFSLIRLIQSQRVELIHAHEFNMNFYAGLAGRITGVPVVMNTSFNLKGEPIVTTPANAHNTFVKSDMDMLVLGNVLVRKK